MSSEHHLILSFDVKLICFVTSSVRFMDLNKINSGILSSISIPCVSLKAIFSTFSMDNVAISAIVEKIVAFSTFVKMYANKYHICWLQSWSIRFPLSSKRISLSAYGMLFRITLSHLHCRQYYCVLR